jgi:hypothetical protein
MNEQAESLTIREAAEALQRSARSVRRYLQEGKLIGEKVLWGTGYKWAISQASVEKLGRRLHRGGAGEGGAGAEQLAAQVRALQAAVEELRAEVVHLSGLREDWQKALPAAGEEVGEPKRRWWQRLGLGKNA